MTHYHTLMGLARLHATLADKMEARLAKWGSGIGDDAWPNVIMPDQPGKVIYHRDQSAHFTYLASKELAQ